jgi:hypothetical protein
MSSTYHPPKKGNEIANKCLEAYLCCFVTDKQNKWLQWLHMVEWWYNYTFHTSTIMTPFQALYSYEPPKWEDFVIMETKIPTVRDQLEENQNVF